MTGFARVADGRVADGRSLGPSRGRGWARSLLRCAARYLYVDEGSSEPSMGAGTAVGAWCPAADGDAASIE